MKVRNLGKWLVARGGNYGDGFCGFSGGADSTALLQALYLAGIKVTAVHFHHGLRGVEADGDAAWCREFCRARGIDFKLEYLDVPGHRRVRESEEECGRRLRLESWKRLTCGNSDTPVYLAHHADDAIENLLLRIARGCGEDGLLGFKDERIVDGVRLVRPFLPLRKEELEEWLRSQKIDWRVDCTNLESCCRRNAVRNRLLPLWREIFGNDQGIYRTVENLRNPEREPDEPAKKSVNVPDVPEMVDWNWREEPEICWGGWGRLSCCREEGERFAGVPGKLRIRRWRAGDRMVPFGGTHHCKLQDLFTDAKIPRELRKIWPVVTAENDEIIWVPGVRRGEYGRCYGIETDATLSYVAEL